MIKRYSFLGSLILLCCTVLFTTNLKAQDDIQVSLVAASNGCTMGSICLGCDGSLRVTGALNTTQIKIFHMGEDPCDAVGGFFEINGDGTPVCNLCDQWDLMWGGDGNSCGDGPWIFPPGTVTTTNNLFIEFQSGGQEYYDEACFTDANAVAVDFNLSTLLADIADDCEEDPACPGGSFSQGGEEGLVDAFVADETGIINFSFWSYTIPDQLVISVNCDEILNSGPWSSQLTTAQIDAGYGNCAPGVVNGGNGTFYTGSINVNAGDNVSIQVIGDNCDVPGTAWFLNVTCGMMRRSVATYSHNGAEEHLLEDAIFEATSGNDIALAIAPNPASSDFMFRLKTSEEAYQVTIYDFTGRVMYSDKNYGGATHVVLDDFDTGLYLIQVTQNDLQTVEKFEVIK